MTRPVRIQLSRQKGWNLQAHSLALNGLPAKKVDRTTRYGNPFPIGKPGPLGRVAPDAEGSVGFFCAMLDDDELRAAAGYPADLSPLRGFNLACWCGPRSPCHCDPILERVNG